MVIRKMQNWTLRLLGLWHLKHERNGGVADCFRTESGELCNQVWDAGSDTASYLGPSCGWGSSITARWRKDRLDGTSVAQETSRKNGCTPENSGCSSHAWTPRHTKAKLLSGELYLQLRFLLTHKRLQPHLQQIMACGLPTLLPIWILQWPSLGIWRDMNERSLPFLLQKFSTLTQTLII